VLDYVCQDLRDECDDTPGLSCGDENAAERHKVDELVGTVTGALYQYVPPVTFAWPRR